MSVIATRHARGRRQRGFTLVEVLVALIVLAIGLLGLAQLQARGLKFNQDAYVRSQATTLAYEIIDRMRSNRDSAELYESTDPGGPYVCDPTTSSPAMDLQCWYERVNLTLPNGTALINRQVDGGGTPTEYYNIIIRWLDRETGGTMQQAWTAFP